MNNGGAHERFTGLQIDKELLESSVVHKNISQEFIITTADKIRLCLMRHRETVKGRSDWIAPAGIFVALVGALVAAKFESPLLYLQPEVWKAMFVLCSIAAFLWLCYAIFRLIKLKGKGDIEGIIEELKLLPESRIREQLLKTGDTADVLFEKASLFHDDFEEFKGWVDYGGGEVTQSSDLAHKGQYSLKKDKKGDPNGGYKTMKSQARLDLVFSGWIYRPFPPIGGFADRLAVEDANFNGYGFAVAHGKNWVQIERRDSGKAKGISPPVVFNTPKNAWYHFKFFMRASGEFNLRLYDSSLVELVSVVSKTDRNYFSFDRVIVHGGHVYYIDDLKVELL